MSASAAALLLSICIPAAACDFCMTPAEGSGKTIRQADGAADARITGRRFVFAADGAARTETTFTVSKVLIGAAPGADKSLRTTLPWRGANATQRAVVLFERTEDGPAFLDAIPDPEGVLADYFGKAFALDPKDAAARIAFYAARLEHAEADIAEDAYRQFVGVPISSLRAASASLDAPRLRGLLKSDAVPGARKGLYALMLGIAGEAKDDALLAGLLPNAESAAAAGGVLAGRCLLTGKTGEVLTAAAGDAKLPAVPRRGVLAVVRALWSEPGVDKDDLRKALSSALGDAELAPFAVDEMARLREDWMTEAIRKLWLDPKRRTGLVRTAVVHYLRALPDGPRRELYDWLTAHP